MGISPFYRLTLTVPLRIWYLAKSTKIRTNLETDSGSRRRSSGVTFHAPHPVRHLHAKSPRIRTAVPGRGGSLRLRPHGLRLPAHRQHAHVHFRRLAAARAGIQWLQGPSSDEHHRRGTPDLRRGYRRGQDGGRFAASGKDGLGDRRVLYRSFQGRHAAAEHPGAGYVVPGDRPYRRADPGDPVHRREGVHLPDFRRDLFRHVEAARLRLPCAAGCGGAGGRRAGRHGGKAQRDRFRPVEIQPAGRETADGMGQSLGRRVPRMAHRVLGHVGEVPRSLVRHPPGRRRPHLGAPLERDRPDRGLPRHAPRQLLDARVFPATGRRQDGEIRRRLPAGADPDRPGLRSPRLPVVLSERELPVQAQLQVGKHRRRRPAAESASACGPRLGRSRRGSGRGIHAALFRGCEQRPEHAPRHVRHLGPGPKRFAGRPQESHDHAVRRDSGAAPGRVATGRGGRPRSHHGAGGGTAEGPRGKTVRRCRFAARSDHRRRFRYQGHAPGTGDHAQGRS